MAQPVLQPAGRHLRAGQTCRGGRVERGKQEDVTSPPGDAGDPPCLQAILWRTPCVQVCSQCAWECCTDRGQERRPRTLLAQPGCTCTSRAKGPYTFCNPIPTHDSWWYYLKRKNEGLPGRQARAGPKGQGSCWQNQYSPDNRRGSMISSARW